MVQNCQPGWKWSEANGRCIKVRTSSVGSTIPVDRSPTTTAPRTGAGYTQDGIPIVSKENADLASKLYGATSVRRGDTLSGAISGADKLAKYRDAGLHPAALELKAPAGSKSVSPSVPEGFEHITASRPAASENEDPKDYQVRIANWEKNQALAQANAIAKSTEKIRGQAEISQIKEREEMFQKRGEDPVGKVIGLGKEANPIYAALTEEEKVFNATLPAGQRVEQYTEVTEDLLTPAQKAARAAGTNVRIMDDKRADLLETAQPETFIDPATGKTKYGDLADHMTKVKQFLGAETGDRVEMRDDGTYFLKDETGEDVDPIKRAELKIRDQETKAVEALDKKHRINSDRIKSLHRTPDGGITEQGKRALQEEQEQYNEDSKDLTEKVDEMLDKTITAEKSRQIDVETQMKALNTPEAKKAKSFAEEVSLAKVGRLNELKAQGIDPLVALAQVEREYSTMKSDPKKIKMSEFISGLDRSGIPMADQFSKIYAEAGNNTDEAYSAMKTRYGEFQAKAMRDQFLSERGWGEKQIERKNIKDTVQDFWTGEVSDPDAVGNFMDQLGDLGYSDDFKRKQLSAMVINPNLTESVKDEARALLSEDYEEATGKAETIAQMEARFASGDMTPEEATNFLKRRDILEDGIPGAGGAVSEENINLTLARIKTGTITNRDMEKAQDRAIKEGWGDRLGEAIKLGKPIGETTAKAYGLPENITRGELDAIVKVREVKGGGNVRYQSNVLVPQNLSSVLDEKRNAQAMIDKYNELVKEAGPRPFEGLIDKGARGLSFAAEQVFGAKPTKELRIYRELEALSGEIMADYIKRMSGAAVSEEEAQRLAKNKPNVDMSSTQFEDQMERYLSDIEDAISEKTTTYGFEDGAEMERAVRGGYIDYTTEEIDEVLGMGKSRQTTSPGTKEENILGLIGDVEAEGNYNAVYGNAGQSEIDFAEKTLDEVEAFQNETLTGGSPSSAIGKYQFLKGTLNGLQKEMGLTGEEKFTPELQDEMAMQLLNRRGWNDYVEGRITIEELQRRLSQEWASLPKDASNVSYYEGDGLNKSLVNTETLRKTITT